MLRIIEKRSKTLNMKIILNHINYKISNGQIITIKVPSIKSEIEKFFMGVPDSELIDIRINGKLVSNYKLKEIRNLILYFPKEIGRFHGTIMEYVKNGSVNISERRIVEASREANSLEFILNLPRGYNTIIDEDWEMLSAEQRLRIAMVKAILSKAPILLLDDNLLDLDIGSEKYVWRDMKMLFRDRIIIVVDSSIDKTENYEIRSN